jgi:hypothetical protein
VGFLIVVLLWGLYAYIHQLRDGLIVTGMRDQISWGLYITNFVFFIGISHAGTLISAILRVTDTEWRTPITRMAEAITVFALCIGGPMVMIDMGRPDRMLNLFRYGRIQSPGYLEKLASVPSTKRDGLLVQESAARVGEHIVRGTCHVCHDATGPGSGHRALTQGTIPSLASIPEITLSAASFTRCNMAPAAR